MGKLKRRGNVRCHTLGIGVLLVLGVASSASGQVMNDQQAGAAVLGETAFGSGATLAEHFRCDPTAQLTLDGTVAPSGSWQAMIRGTYAGQPVMLDYQSFFDVFYDVSGRGTFGDHNWSAQARADFSTDRKILVMVGDGQVGPFPFDWHWIKNWILVVPPPPAPPRVLDDGLFVLTFLGRPIAKWKQTSFMTLEQFFKYRFTKIRREPPGCKIVIKGGGTTRPDGVVELKSRFTFSIP